MKKILILLLSIASLQAQAISLDWTGGYRLEYTHIDCPTLGDPCGTKSYGTNYLYLQPRVIASDGINIVGRFDIFGSEYESYRNSQVGSFWGNGLNRTGAAASGSNATSQSSNAMNLRVSQLYLNVEHEYGSLVAGRAPIEFGMGITHNAGNGPFDHWMDVQDMVGYRFIVDNVSFMPILSKVYQTDFGIANSISDQIFILDYNNKEIGARAGVLHQTRKSSDGSNDALLAFDPTPATPTLTKTGAYKAQTVNVFLERKWTGFEFRLEGSFLTGTTGLYSAGEEITLNAYAVAGEVLFPAREGKWEYSGKFGVVSGDDGSTAAYEGYQLDRNYDVAMLMFNHRMGFEDLLSTGPLHNQGNAEGLSKINSADDEAIGNAVYLSPSVKYSWNDKLDIKGTLTYGQLMTNPKNFVDFKKDLGIELDTEVIYRPRERVTWSNGIGLLMPGNAWKASSTGTDHDNKMNYGFVSKAAITF